MSKICKEGKEISSKSGRCVKKCNEDLGEKRDPKSGKCVSSPKKPLDVRKKSEECDFKGKLFNPATRRCIQNTTQNRKKIKAIEESLKAVQGGDVSIEERDVAPLPPAAPAPATVVSAVVTATTTTITPPTPKVTFKDMFDKYFIDQKSGEFVKISGPLSFTYFPQVDGKTFYLFGDLHTEGDGCKGKNNRKIPFKPAKNSAEADGTYRIAELLEKIFKDETTRKDFYFEISYIFSIMKSSLRKPEHWGYLPNSSIFSVEKKFLDCFNIPKTLGCNKKYPTTRFHYTDIRFEKDLTISGNFGINAEELFILIEGSQRELSSVISSKKVHERGEPANKFKLKLTLKQAQGLSDFLTFGRIISQLTNLYLDEKFDLKSAIQTENIIDKEKVLEFLIPKFREKIIKSIKKSYLVTQILNFHKILIDDLYAELFQENKEVKDLLDEQTDLNSFLTELSSQISSTSANNVIVEFEVKGYALAETFKRILLKYMTSIGRMAFYTAARIMDVYTLSRIFRASTSDSNEVFIYAGDLHISNIKNFLKNVVIADNLGCPGRTTLPVSYTFTSKTESSKCINIKKIKKDE